MPIHALIFDLDGTLADSLHDIGDALNRALLEQGLPTHSLEAYRHMVGEGVEVLVNRALGAAAQGPNAAQLVKSTTEAYRSHYREAAHQKTWPYPGIDELLRALSAVRVPMAVLSNKKDDFTKALVAQRFGHIRFVAVRGEQDGVPRKPNPTAALELALELNVLPANIGFVGDTAIDMKTARAAGMHAIGVLWGFRSRAELEGAGAQHVLSEPREVLPLVGASSTLG